MAVWVVIPTYNEAANVATVVAGVRAQLDAAAPGALGRVLVVDDASPDGTGAIADALADVHDEVEVLHRPAKSGLAGAYVDGMTRALRGGASHVVQMDADGSHDPADVPRLLEAAAGADVVIGSRYVPGGRVRDWPLRRRAISRLGGRYAAAVLRLGVADPTGGFKCFRADALRSVGLAGVRAQGYAFQVETTFRAIRAGLRVVEVPITFGERAHGRSKMSAAIALEAAWRLPLMRVADLPLVRRSAAAPRVAIR